MVLMLQKVIKFILLLSISTFVTAAPVVNFVDILEKYNTEQLEIFTASKNTFYMARHMRNITNLDYPYEPLYIAENESIISYTNNTENFLLSGNYGRSINIPDAILLNKSLNKIPGIATTHEIDEVYSINYIEEELPSVNDYVVAQGQPWSFTENPDAASYMLSRRLDIIPIESDRNITLFRVKGPYNAKSIAAYSKEAQSEGQAVYTYGSSFKITNVTKKTINVGELTGKTYTEIDIVEVDSIPEGISPFSYDLGSIERIPIEALDTENIPEHLQVKVEKYEVNEEGSLVKSKKGCCIL